MSNLYDLERHRLKLYGQMLKNDLNEKRKSQKMSREEVLKRDAEELQQHIQNTHKFDSIKKAQLKQLGYCLRQDNARLIMLKKSSPVSHPFSEQGSNIINEICSMDSQRLSKIKGELIQQVNQNHSHINNKRNIQYKIKQIQKVQDERHKNRIQSMQLQSLRNYEDIKRKHQQDMQLYQKHKRLQQQNQNYQKKIESFTNVDRGIFDRYNRNQYQQRKMDLISNQNQIKKQIDEFNRKKSQEIIQYKKSKGDLEHSMLGTVFMKAPKDEKAYSNELKTQMMENNLRKSAELSDKKQKIKINNILGGVPGIERQKMIRIIDRGLGLDQYESRLNRSANDYNGTKKTQIQRQELRNQTNPQNTSQIKLSSTSVPRKNSSIKKYVQYDLSQSEPNKYMEQNVVSSTSHTSERPNSNKYYMSYDVVTGKHKYYGAD